MDFFWADFNGADEYYEGAGSAEWADIAEIVSDMPIYMQPSDQARKVGTPIFDPKATNGHLTASASARRWRKVPVPRELTAFGTDWDAGKNGTLAEWQFSNYPFLWNNIIRTEAVIKNGYRLPNVGTTNALLVVTKSGMFPASNSTLYFEQANAQLGVVTELDVFSTPIRLLGLAVPEGAREVEVVWSQYSARYGRDAQRSDRATLPVRWTRGGKHGNDHAVFGPPI